MREWTARRCSRPAIGALNKQAIAKGVHLWYGKSILGVHARATAEDAPLRPGKFHTKEKPAMNLKLSENLRRLRRERGMPPNEQADRLGVSYLAVSRWENESSYPDIE